VTTKRIAIVLIDDFADWEVGFFAAAARSWLGAGIRHYAPGGRTIRSMGGLLVTPEASLEMLAVADFDALAIVGSSGWEKPDAPDLGPIIREALEAGLPVGAICGATLAAARSGVLAGRRHTSNAKAYLSDHVEGYDGAGYVDTPKAVIDGGLVTAPGSAPASFACGLIGLIWPNHPIATDLMALVAREHVAG